MQVNSFTISFSDIVMLMVASLTSSCQLIGIRAMMVLCQNPGQDGLFMVCWMIQSYGMRYVTCHSAATLFLQMVFLQSCLDDQILKLMHLWSLSYIYMICIVSSSYYLLNQQSIFTNNLSKLHRKLAQQTFFGESYHKRQTWQAVVGFLDPCPTTLQLQANIGKLKYINFC